MLIVHKSGQLLPSFHYWKLGNPLAKLHLSTPISLKSCVVKLLKKIVADHLYYIVEKKNLFSWFQAGVHKGPSCKDQITCKVQATVDGFQQCLILTLLGFSKACSTVWREKLKLSMLDPGISSTFIQWLQSFLNNCRAHVQLFNVLSSSHCFTLGLPQVSVLAPLLILFHINKLAASLANNAAITLFADKVLILTTALKKEDPKAAAQSLVNSVFDCSR